MSGPRIRRSLSVPPDPLLLAEAVAGDRDFALLWTADGSGASYVGVHVREHRIGLDPEPSLPSCDSDDPLDRAPRWVGLLPYEALRSLERPALTPPERRDEPHVCRAQWWRFAVVVVVRGGTVTVLGDDASLVDRVMARLASGRASRPEAPRIEALPGEPPERHVRRVRQALELIAAGQVYQVNLARRLDFEVRGHPLAVLRHMCRHTRPPYAMALRAAGVCAVSTSPELCLLQRGARQLETHPIKGTRPWTGDRAEGERAARELDADPKERAELSMIVDVERNDLGRVAELGSVRLAGAPRVVSHGLVWHRVARVCATLRRGVGRAELLSAFLPSGSVTGAPKVRAMEIIADLEAERRGLYTGAFGVLDHAGRLNLAMAIRTLTVREGRGHYFTGGGIVADSDAERELQETWWKARQLLERAG